jgi:acyl-CoA synthetase (AMP-forming)/AMP-acid ligase II
MNQATLLARAALTFPARPAVTDGSRERISYAELAARAARLAGGVRDKLGLQPGDRVALAMKNSPAYFEILYGLWWAGIAAVPINAKLHRSEFAFILENSGARAVFVTPDLSEVIAPLKDDITSLEYVIEAGSADHNKLMSNDPADLTDAGPDDLAWVFYTSGTTGRPKGAMLTNRNLMAMVTNYFADVDDITPYDCMIHGAPLSHGAGLYALPHIAKAANNVIPDSGGFDPAETFAMLPEFPGASFFFAPTMVTRLINAADAATADTANLKTIVYGGGPMYVEDTLKALDILGPKLMQIYGQGESPMTITGLSKAAHADRDHPSFLARLGSAGTARMGVDVRVVDGDDRDLPIGETGEIICRGDVVMPGYWQNPAANMETMRGGWLHTGDVGAFDGDGFLTLKDRSKDMIISGGSNIYPREVEEVLLRHRQVAECSVIGRPHEDWGEEVVAFVVPDSAAKVTTEELDQLCLDNIARFKRPKDYRFVASLPKNNYGKVLKTELRSLLAAEEK